MLDSISSGLSSYFSSEFVRALPRALSPQESEKVEQACQALLTKSPTRTYTCTLTQRSIAPPRSPSNSRTSVVKVTSPGWEKPKQFHYADAKAACVVHNTALAVLQVHFSHIYVHLVSLEDQAQQTLGFRI